MHCHSEIVPAWVDVVVIVIFVGILLLFVYMAAVGYLPRRI